MRYQLPQSAAAETGRLLEAFKSERPLSAAELVPLVYRDLKALASTYLARESFGHTLQATALVNEAFIRLVDQTRVDWKGRTHFFAVAANAMRRILVDHARAKKADKRGGGWLRVTLDDDAKLSVLRDADVLTLDDALDALERLDPLQARIVELRFFGGLSVREVATSLGLSKRRVEEEWTVTRAWLRRELRRQG